MLEKTLESPLDYKEIKLVNPKGNQSWCWSWNSTSLATWCQELTHWKRPWCWERLKAGERDDRGWGGWMASPTRWTWIWVSSGSWWWTRKPGVLQSMGSQSRTRLSDWIELNCTLIKMQIQMSTQNVFSSRQQLNHLVSWKMRHLLELKVLPVDSWF